MRKERTVADLHNAKNKAKSDQLILPPLGNRNGSKAKTGGQRPSFNDYATPS